MDHNTKPTPHKDREGRECRGPFYFAVDPTSAQRGKRLCYWCRREEFYSLNEVAVIFREDVSAEMAIRFLTEEFKIGGTNLMLVIRDKADKRRSFMEQDGMVAVVVSASLAGVSPDLLIEELEKKDTLVRAAIRVMEISFSSVETSPPMRQKASAGRKDPPDFPDEFSGRY